MTLPRKLAVLALAVAILSEAMAQAAGNDPLAWPSVTAAMRPWTWWWWHGSAVDETNLAHELAHFHEAGLGGVQVTAIYGTKGAEAQEIPYLSPRWLAVMGYTVDEASKLGMGVDMSLGSGWCFGGPTVSDQDANARVVVEEFKVAGGGAFTNRLNRRTTQALVAFSRAGGRIDLTRKIHGHGAGDWVAPAGDWTVYAVSQRPSGQRVKRPAPGGEGWMLNPAYAQAVRDWLPWFDRAFARYHGSRPAAVFQDSYEYHTDWAPDFFREFRRLRGYELQTELPALFGDVRDERAARVKYDYRRTLSDIMVQQCAPAWIGWAHHHGFSTIYQAHGTPANWLDLYGQADIPETEMFHHDRSVLISKFASSAAHTQGRLLIGAETGTWLKEHFTAPLADLKYLADDLFLAGVNHIYFHGACYSPEDAPWPGWLFYASTEINPRNPIWRDVGALDEYITRCQSFLQSGASDDDILLYWPVADFWSDPAGLVQPMGVSQTDWFEGQPVGRVAHELWNRGFAFDYVSDAQLLGAKASDGGVQLPGGNYQIIVVPRCRYMPAETIRKLFALAKDGATVSWAGGLPTAVAGRHDSKTQADYDGLKRRYCFGNALRPDAGGACRVGKGRFVFGDSSENPAWADLSRETMADDGLAFVRRSLGHDWIYLIANRTQTNFDGWIQLARHARSAVMLDPLTGCVGVAAVEESRAENSPNHSRIEPPNCRLPVGPGPRVRLQLFAGQSVILRLTADTEVRGRPWQYWEHRRPAAPTQTLAGDWRIRFIAGGPTLPPDFQTAQLASWTRFPVPGVEAFAGTAGYKLTFDAPAGAGRSMALDLGDVRQSARVRVNGKDYGTLFTPPYRVVVDNLQQTDNVLEVEVTSVAANRVRDLDRRGVNWKIFKDINLVDINYAPFNAAHWPLTDCGLLGPVTLTAVAGQPKAR